MVGIIDFNKVYLYIFPFSPCPFITFVMQSSTQLICLLHTGFTCMSTHNGYLCLFLLVRQLLCADLFDGRPNWIDNVDMKQKNWGSLLVRAIRKKYQCQHRELIHWWNPCFKRKADWWYPKDLEATFMPKHFLYYQQNKFEKFHLHWCFVWQITRWHEQFTAVVD